MRVTIAAVGRMKSGPEAELVTDYLTRFDRTGRALSLGPANLVEVEDRKGGGMAGEGALLEAALPDGARMVALDERGKMVSSPRFSEQLAGWRDDGARDLAFVIGGADGLDPALRARADSALSSGRWSGRTCWSG